MEICNIFDGLVLYSEDHQLQADFGRMITPEAWLALLEAQRLSQPLAAVTCARRPGQLLLKKVWRSDSDLTGSKTQNSDKRRADE